jgi:hypothetical protein
MFQLKWSRALIVLAMLVCLFAIGLAATPSAHAAGVSLTTTTTTKTSTVKASTRFCTFLKKSFPTHAGEAHFCDIQVVVTNVITRRTGDAVSLSPNSCYPVTIHHLAHYTWIATLPPPAGFAQSENFTYGCSAAPVISNHQCNGWWALPPVTISQGGCFDYPNGSGHTQAEDDVYVSSIWGGTLGLYGYTDAGPNGNIHDWCTCSLGF